MINNINNQGRVHTINQRQIYNVEFYEHHQYNYSNDERMLNECRLTEILTERVKNEKHSLNHV